MYKANGRLSDAMFNKKNIEQQAVNINTLKKAFSREGKFEAFKHTSSYTEIPPITKANDSGTYIRRKYKGVELVTLGSTPYFVECEALKQYLYTRPKFLTLGSSGLRVIRVDASFKYLNRKGQQFQQTLIKEWETLTQPVFSYKHY